MQCNVEDKYQRYYLAACALTLIFLRVGVIGHGENPPPSPTSTESGEEQNTVADSARESREHEKEKEDENTSITV